MLLFIVTQIKKYEISPCKMDAFVALYIVSQEISFLGEFHSGPR